MSPFKEIRVDHLGAELGSAMCHESSCKGYAFGWVDLAHYHNGYGEEAQPATEDQIDEVYIAAMKHVAQHPTHPVRVIFGTGEIIRQEDGNSLSEWFLGGPIGSPEHIE